MRLRAFLVAAGIAALGVAPSARADDFVVTTLTDGTGTCNKTDCTTIRAALAAAGATAATDDTVTVPPGTTTLTGGDLVPPSGVAISGASARTTIIQGDGKARIFTIGGERVVTFANLTMANGTASGGQGGNLLVGASAIVGLSHVRVTGGDAAQGAGIAATAPRILLIQQSLIDNNVATPAPSGAGGDGGGIYFQGTSAARTLAINDTTVAFDSARNGGGIDLVTNAQTTATLTRLTVARNTSTVSRGGGIHLDSSGPITSTASIFAGNTGNVGAGAPVPGPANCTVTFGDGGSNLESGSDCGFKLSSDRQNTDPGLSTALFNAGGQTDLLTVPATSAAVDLAGACAATGAATDQRDMPRPQGSACDSGAYEYVLLDTTITGGPSGPVSAAIVSFTHTSTDPLAGFECRLDGPGTAVGTFAKCGSTATYRSLADGAYTFRVRAVHGDLVDGTPDTRAFSIDTVAPAAPAITSPADNSSQNSSTVALTGTAEAGATVEVFEGATSRGTTTADGSGNWTRSIPSVGDGSHTYTATARDAAGNVSGNSNSRTVIVDTAAPAAPTIASPAENALQNTSTVTLSGATEPFATVEVFEGATSKGTATANGNGGWSRAIAGVADGTHAYVARATDLAGNVSGNSNTRTVRVDTTAPETTITGGPNGPTNNTTPSFTFTSESNTTFECRLDTAVAQGTYAACTSPKAYSTLAAGSYTFIVRATDAAGNVDPTPASRAFTVDTTPPETTITSGPTGTTTVTAPIFTFGTSEPGTFQCKLDGPGATLGTPAPCVSGRGYGPLADGTYTFTVTATDLAGNPDPTPATRMFTVDTTAPAAPAITAPADNALQGSSTVTLSGTAEAGATVEVFEGAASRGTATAAGGVWTVTINGAADGSHVYTAKATDAALNTSVASATRTVRVDTAAPAAPAITSPADNALQNSSNVTLSGTAEAGATVEVFEGAASRGTTTANGSGNWTRAIAGASDGSHAYTAKATDAAGNTSAASAARTVRVDTTAPAAPAITAPADNSAQSSTTVTLSGTAEANAVVEVFEGATSRGTTLASGTGAWTRVIAGASETTHTYTARATDAAGNTSGGSNTRTIRVDLTAPVAPAITAPADNSAQNTTTVTLSGTAEANAVVEVFEGATSRGTTLASGTGAWTRVIAGATEATHTYTARATDTAGNTSAASNTRTVRVDTTAPAAPAITAPADNALQNSATVTLSGIAEAGATVEVFEGAASRGTTTANGSGNWTRAIPSVGDGTHTYTAKATDAAGNTSAASSTRSVRVDTTVPAAPAFTSPADNALQNSATVTLSGTAEAGAAVEVFEGATPRGTTTATGGTWTVTINGAADGTHVYTAKATDAANNTSAASATRSVRVDTAAPAAPAITSPADNALQNSATVTLSGTAEAGATVEVFEGAASRGTTTANGSGNWTRAIPSVGDGTHTYTAKATDAAGNTSAASNTRSVRVDTTAPAAPAFTSPADNALQNSATVTLSGTAEAGATVEIFEGAASRGTVTATGGNWTRTLTLVPDGQHVYTATATDAAGNTSAASAGRTVLVDTGPPAAPAITSPAADAMQNSATVTLSGTAEPGATVEVFEGAASRGTVTATGGNWARHARSASPTARTRTRPRRPTSRATCRPCRPRARSPSTRRRRPPT